MHEYSSADLKYYTFEKYAVLKLYENYFVE